jgi:hypothetical protein
LVSPSVTFEASNEFEEALTRDTTEVPQSSGADALPVTAAEVLDFDCFLLWNSELSVKCNIGELRWSMIPRRASNEEHDFKPGDRVPELVSNFFRKTLSKILPSFKNLAMIKTALL